MDILDFQRRELLHDFLRRESNRNQIALTTISITNAVMVNCSSVHPCCDGHATRVSPVHVLVRLFLAAALFVPTVLLLDGPGLARQSALGAATALFLALLIRRVDSKQVAIAIVIATAGEMVLSLGWGLYEYRHAAIPLYVPFGHGVFYALAALASPRLRDHEQRIVRGTLLIGSVIAAVSYFAMQDEWGLLWWIAAAALIARSRNALLLSICFAMTVLLEWLGTGLGNWRWAAEVPGLGLHSANPPSGVGILYVILDTLTLAVARATQGRTARRLRGMAPVTK